MNEQHGINLRNDNDQENQQVFPGPTASHSHKEVKVKDGDGHEDEPAYVHYRKEGALRRRWNEFWRIGLDRYAELILAAAIAYFAYQQWHTADINNAHTGAQVERLICAANGVRDAAASFSGSAAQINTGIGLAVGELGIQADKMDAARIASVKEAETSLQLDQRAWVGLSNFQDVRDTDPEDIAAGHRIMPNAPISVIKTVYPALRNTGKTPAKGTMVYWGHFNADDIQALNLAISDSSWMKQVLQGAEKGILGGVPIKDIPDGVVSYLPRYTYESRVYMNRLNDPDLFPPGTGEHGHLEIPATQVIGVLPPNQVVTLGNGKHMRTATDNNLIIFGKVTYRDIWGNPKETTFCNYLVKIGDNFSICPAYNDME